MKLHNFPKHLSIAVIPSDMNWRPSVLRKSEIKSTIVHGFLLEFLSEALKFSFDHKYVTKFHDMQQRAVTKFHDTQQNVNITDCYEMVAREEVDISICSNVITESRYRQITYSIPYLYSTVKFVTDKPQVLANKFAIFYSFSWQIWLTLTVSFMFMSFAFYVLFKRKYNYPYVFLQVFSCLCEQSFNLKSEATSARILKFSWIIGAMCLTYSYKAVLLAFISFPNLIGIHNIKELSEAALNPEFKCFSYGANKYLVDVLHNSSVESFRNIANCILRTSEPWDEDYCVMDTSYKKAYLNADYYLIGFKNIMFLTDDKLWSEMFAVVMNKRFCCMDTLNDAIYRIIETGLIEKHLKDKEFFSTFDVMSRPHATHVTPNRILTLDDLFGAFIILIGGLMLSVFVFILEFQFCEK